MPGYPGASGSINTLTGGEYVHGVQNQSGTWVDVAIELSNLLQSALAAEFSTLQATGLITPASAIGILGTATNDNAQAGSIGEYFELTPTATSLTSGTRADFASKTLAAGDYEVDGSALFTATGGAVMTAQLLWLNTVSATTPSAPYYGEWQVTVPANGNFTGIAPRRRFSLASSGTVYLSGFAVFSSGSMTASPLLRIRRAR